jgi:hypothetical protein
MPGMSEARFAGEVVSFGSKARRCGTSQALLVGDGLARKPPGGCSLCCNYCARECLGSVVTSPIATLRLNRWRAGSLFVRPCRGRNGGYAGTKSMEGSVTACRDRCGRWQVCSDAVVLSRPKVDFCAVRNRRSAMDRLNLAQSRK